MPKYRWLAYKKSKSLCWPPFFWKWNVVSKRDLLYWRQLTKCKSVKKLVLRKLLLYKPHFITHFLGIRTILDSCLSNLIHYVSRPIRIEVAFWGNFTHFWWGCTFFLGLRQLFWLQSIEIYVLRLLIFWAILRFSCFNC